MVENLNRWLKSVLPPVCLVALASMVLTACDGLEPGAQSTDDEGIFFIQSGDQASVSHALSWGLPTAVLRDNPITGVALEITVPAASELRGQLRVDRNLEFYVLAGQVSLAGRELLSGDYLQTPAGLVIDSPRSAAGSRLLMFSIAGYPAELTMDNATQAKPGRLKVIYGASQPWVAGTAMKKAGRDDVPLKIKHFRRDPKSGARTYLVSVGPGLAIPWETHTIAEEGYLVSGDYTLPECLPEGLKTGTYQPGGYFYRPPGIAHNGPQSGSSGGAVMLVRTPGPLTVTLVDGCQ